MTAHVNNDAIPALVKARAAFCNRTGSVHAAHHQFPPNRGEMPQAAYDALATDWRAGTYVVFSYGTPIAWARPGDELLAVPHMRYSNTTSRHQRLCRYSSEYGTVGVLLDVGDPGKVREGRGQSPYGPRYGW